MQCTSTGCSVFKRDGVVNFTKITRTTVRLRSCNSQLKHATVTAISVTAEAAVAANASHLVP